MKLSDRLGDSMADTTNITAGLASEPQGASLFAPAPGYAPYASNRESEGVGGVFGVIYCDPPWRYDFAETDSRKIENHYPTMSLSEICALQVPAAKDCVLYMWATAPKLLDAIAVIHSWSFVYKTHAIWDKKKIGSGYWFRGQHELLMVATRGKVSPPVPEQRISSVIGCTRGPHSRKPDYVRDQIAKWFPSERRLEMFSRVRRPGWEPFGNDVEHDLLSGGGGGFSSENPSPAEKGHNKEIAKE
jgi:N6-adenosine-specific RNA methylase IME4